MAFASRPFKRVAFFKRSILDDELQPRMLSHPKLSVKMWRHQWLGEYKSNSHAVCAMVKNASGIVFNCAEIRAVGIGGSSSSVSLIFRKRIHG
jgi:hypothetical protein